MPGHSPPTLPRDFRELFDALEAAGYHWEPVTPERLLALRRAPEGFDALTRHFGLGLDVPAAELAAQGVSAALLTRLAPLRPAVSRLGDAWVVHSHWPAISDRADEYVYCGPETQQLLRQLEPERASFAGRRGLDLGSGAGGLSFALARAGARMQGLEPSAPAVEWSRAAAEAQGLDASATFARGSVGETSGDRAVPAIEFDFAVFNPPMTVPTPGERRPHRDGGALGIELPLKFLEFAAARVRPGGEAWCLATNPLVRGRPALLERLRAEPLARRWEIIERRVLHDRFNHALARKENYEAQGIERIELCCFRLLRLAN